MYECKGMPLLMEQRQITVASSAAEHAGKHVKAAAELDQRPMHVARLVDGCASGLYRSDSFDKHQCYTTSTSEKRQVFTYVVVVQNGCFKRHP